jgi:TolB-like protein
MRGPIFSLSVWFCTNEMSTGKQAFEGTTSAVVFDAILHGTPKSPTEWNPEIPPQLENIINKALEKDRDLRYQTSVELRADLKRLKRDREAGGRHTPAKGSPVASGEHAAAARQEKSVAVLYFENLSSAKEDEYFRDGMTEDIITELANIRDLKVFPRPAMLPYRDKSVTAPQVGQELKAFYVLGGSLRRSGSRLRVTAQLGGTGQRPYALGTALRSRNGRAYFASGRYREADELVERVIEANGDDYNVYIP